MEKRWKMLEIKIELIRKKDNEKIIKQSKKTFNGIQKSYTTYHSYTFKKTEVRMHKEIYLGFAVIELSKLLTHETYYDKLQPYFGPDNLQLHYMDCDSFVLSITTQNTNNYMKNLE